MRFLALVLALTLSAPAHVQPAGSDWTKVQAIPAGTQVRINSQHGRLTCIFVTADPDSLTCTRTQTFFFFPITRRHVLRKPEVSSVKLSHQFLSGLAGAGIGAGAGAGIGAGVASRQSSNEDGQFVTVFFALFGGFLGGSIGSATDFLAAPIVYRAP